METLELCPEKEESGWDGRWAVVREAGTPMSECEEGGGESNDRVDREAGLSQMCEEYLGDRAMRFPNARNPRTGGGGKRESSLEREQELLRATPQVRDRETQTRAAHLYCCVSLTHACIFWADGEKSARGEWGAAPVSQPVGRRKLCGVAPLPLAACVERVELEAEIMCRRTTVTDTLRLTCARQWAQRATKLPPANKAPARRKFLT